MSLKSYWNAKAGNKEFTIPFKIELVKKSLSKKSSILDCGCGYGRILKQLSEEGYSSLFGIDFSEKMIEIAKKNLPQCEFKTNKDSSIPFPDNSFDCVVLVAVLTCIPENNAQEKLMQEIVRTLKPGGIIYIGDFLLNDDERNLARYEKFRDNFESFGTFELEDGGVLRHHSKEWIKKLTSAFKTIECSESVFRTMNGNASKGFCFIGQIISAASQ